MSQKIEFFRSVVVSYGGNKATAEKKAKRLLSGMFVHQKPKS
jgi:hypothetical protein